MENTKNVPTIISADYVELMQFIDDNRQQIVEDWPLLIEVLSKLEKLLKSVTSMTDLHKDAAIMLHVIRMEQDKLLKDIRNEVTLDRIVQISGTELMDGFFSYVKSNSLAIQFVDTLVLDYEVEEQPSRKNTTAAVVESVDSEQEVRSMEDDETLLEIGDILESIKNTVVKRGRVEFFELIMDRYSYSKTLSNAFNLALALRKKLVSLDFSESRVSVTPYSQSGDQDGHCVFEITPEQYNRLNSMFK